MRYSTTLNVDRYFCDVALIELGVEIKFDFSEYLVMETSKYSIM